MRSKRADGSRGRSRQAAFGAFVGAAFALGGCSRPLSHHLLDAAMSSAYRPPSPQTLSPARPAIPGDGPRYMLLGGDLHCHVSPPDVDWHASRGIAETVELARREKIDFVVLTPHVPALFFQGDSLREEVLGALSSLERSLPAMGPEDPIFVVGFEYTDYHYGHVGAGFADLRAVLGDVSARSALTDPARFFEAYVKRGGLLVVNHPLLGPIDSVFSMAKANLSWRPFTAPGPYPDEIRGADRVAQAFEVYNLAVSELRDRFLLGETRATLEATFSRLDKEIPRRNRPMAPVGGSDSHSGHLRAATFVLAEERSARGVREAIVAGRVCVRDPAACTFEARASGESAWRPPGSAIRGTAMIEARARGGFVRIVVNGAEIAPEEPGESVFVPVEPGRCSVVRARVDEGYSGPIYVNCPFGKANAG
jgi:hypothetical protein